MFANKVLRYLMNVNSIIEKAILFHRKNLAAQD